MASLPRIISPDDHVQAPAHVWQDRLPAKWKEAGPRIERKVGKANLGAGDIRFVDDPNGFPADVWQYDGKQIPLVRIAAAAGFGRNEVDARPVTYDGMRKGCWNPEARLADMDIAGIEASVCYPNMFVRFCGQTFSLAQDKDLALACIEAYNDFIVEEWCGGSNGRLVPMGIVPLWDMALAVKEVERLGELGFRSVTLPEAPHLLGLPSIFSKEWDPVYAACAANGIVASLHIGTGGFPSLAKDAPGSIPNVTASLNSCYTLVDFLMSGIFVRIPELKVCMAESQLGWIPYMLSRADFVWAELRGEGFSDIDKGAMPEPPSYYFKRNVWVTFFRDPIGLQMLDHIGIDRVLYETDYPHTDTAWPECQSVGAEMVSHLTPADQERVLAGNARDLFRVETASGTM